MEFLHLNLKKEWFDMIQSRVKREEYREIKPYWNRVFVDGKIKIKGKYYHPTDVIICFSNGYAKNRRQNSHFCKGLKVGEGNPKWGAIPGKQYYVLSIGDILPF